jgi:hypothetical protein
MAVNKVHGTRSNLHNALESETSALCIIRLDAILMAAIPSFIPAESFSFLSNGSQFRLLSAFLHADTAELPVDKCSAPAGSAQLANVTAHRLTDREMIQSAADEHHLTYH